MREELLHFYKGVNDNDDVHVIIVTGSGRAFCAGMDLTEVDLRLILMNLLKIIVT